MSNRFHNKFHRHNHHTDPTDRATKYPDSAYDPIASRESPFKGEFYSEGDITTTQDISAFGNLNVNNGSFNGSVGVSGNLNVGGEDTYLNTNVWISSAVDVNYGGTTTPILKLHNGATDILYVKSNTTIKPYFVGVGVNNPNEKLTVFGNISASGVLYDGTFDSNKWNSTYTTVCANSAFWTSAYNAIQSVQSTLTAFESVQNEIGDLAEFIPILTVNTATSTALVQHNLNVTNAVVVTGNTMLHGNLSANAEFSFYKFKSTTVNFASSDNQVLALPSETVNDLVITTNSNFETNIAIVSALSNGRAGAFFVLTNGMTAFDLELLSNENIRLRGSNTLSLTLSYGDSCCVRCRDNQVVSIW